MAHDSGVVMKTISKLAAMRLDHHTTAHGAVLSYQRLVAGPRALFAAPPADLFTLVIAEAMKRKARPPDPTITSECRLRLTWPCRPDGFRPVVVASHKGMLGRLFARRSNVPPQLKYNR